MHIENIGMEFFGPNSQNGLAHNKYCTRNQIALQKINQNILVLPLTNLNSNMLIKLMVEVTL